MADDAEDQVVLYELFMSGDEPVEQDGDLVWKTILREGEFAMTPTTHGPEDKPFRVVADGKSDPRKRIISMSELEESFEDKVFEHVTLPLSHKDTPMENTGFIDKLRRKVIDGVEHLQGGMRFTEPEVRGKIDRGSIANCSSGIFFNFKRKHDGRRFPVALKHAALTNTPWVNDMGAFGVAASDDEVEVDEVQAYRLASDEETEEAGEVVWKQEESANWLRDQVQARMSDLQKRARSLGSEVFYWVRDVSPSRGTALVEQEGEGAAWVIPFSVGDDDEVSIADASRWIETRQVMVAASDDATDDEDEEQEEREDDREQEDAQEPPVENLSLGDTMDARLGAARERRGLRKTENERGGDTMAGPAAVQLDSLGLSDEIRTQVEAALRTRDEEIERLQAEDRKSKVEQEIAELSDAGFREAPGLLKYVRRVKLRDDGEIAGILAADDENKEQEVTLSQVIDGFIERLPKNQEGKYELSAQALGHEAGEKPADNADEENQKSHEQQLEEGYDALGIERVAPGGEK